MRMMCDAAHRKGDFSEGTTHGQRHEHSSSDSESLNIGDNIEMAVG